MKNVSGNRLSRAERRQVEARAQLRTTVDELRTRLSPRTLARRAGEQVVEASEAVAEAGMLAARRNSRRIAGVAAALALLLLRKRIARWLRRPRAGDATADGESSLTVKRASAHRRRRSR